MSFNAVHNDLLIASFVEESGARRQFLPGNLMNRWMFCTAAVGLVLSAISTWADEEGKPSPKTVWLPIANDSRAVCVQGPNSTGSHKGLFAWDFVLDEGEQVVAVADGRVLWVIDGNDKTGFNSFDDSNHIFVDHGGGIFATYTHHKTGTARVRPGQLIAAGTHLADVGKVGTITPHIHFDLRGPSWHQSHDTRFRTAADQPIEIRAGQACLSATPNPIEVPKKSPDSILKGDEFSANGIRVAPRARAFWLQNEKPWVISGRVLEQAQEVQFQLWQVGKPGEYFAQATPNRDGSFRLPVRIPKSSQGPRWYRLTIRNAHGRQLNTASLPAMVE